jgi:hypothetical protein
MGACACLCVSTLSAAAQTVGPQMMDLCEMSLSYLLACGCNLLACVVFGYEAATALEKMRLQYKCG